VAINILFHGVVTNYIIHNHATGYNQPHHWVSKPAYLVPIPSQDKAQGCGMKSIWCKNGGDDRGGPLISLAGVASSRWSVYLRLLSSLAL